MDTASPHYQQGRTEGEQLLRDAPEDARKAYQAYSLMVARGPSAFRFRADYEKAAGFVEVARPVFDPPAKPVGKPPKVTAANRYETEDGRTLRKTRDGWTDGDAEYDANGDGLPIDDAGGLVHGHITDRDGRRFWSSR
jgi:hypothetical protein